MVPPGQTAVERLEAVWGADVARTLLPVSYAVGSFRVSGFIQRPADAQPTGRRTQLFINGRPFRDNFLVRAAEAGYRSAIHPGDRPSLFLELETANEDVDVNVHPAKLEVRFRDRMGIERVVEEAVRDALGKLHAAAIVHAPHGSEFRVPSSEGRAGGFSPHSELFPDAETEVGEDADAPPQANRNSELGTLFQLFNTYIIFEGAEGLVFVDQHSAHERVLFEGVMADIERGGMAGQRLLLPVTLELTDEELDVVESYGDVLSRVGFEVEPFGGRTVAIHAVPTPHPKFDAARCFQEMVADLARGRFGAWANRLERFAATYACRAAVKGGDPLDEREQRELLSRLFTCTLPPHDVHGRSTIVQLPREELERRFGRR